SFPNTDTKPIPVITTRFLGSVSLFGGDDMAEITAARRRAGVKDGGGDLGVVEKGFFLLNGSTRSGVD
nr:hypothetical protein [Tanacetum cinerariifolium]